VSGIPLQKGEMRLSLEGKKIPANIVTVILS
jgi:hypothetical protein